MFINNFEIEQRRCLALLLTIVYVKPLIQRQCRNFVIWGPVQTSIMGPHFLVQNVQLATFYSTGIIAFLWGFSTTPCYRNISIESFDIFQHSKELQ